MIWRRNFVKTAMLGSVAAMASRAPLLSEPIPQSAGANGLRFGANYVPRKRWWYCWQDWDQPAIAEDLNAVAGLGLDHIRIQCLWPVFQPGINSVSDQVLANLHSLLEAADKANLDVEITVLNGWMSGFAFMPAWVAPLANTVSDQNRNMFVSPAMVEAEKLLFRKIAETVGGHRRFLGFDIGNELGVLQNIRNNPVSQKDADAWATEMLHYCEEIAPGRFHVNGVDHSHWFNDFGFSRANLATAGHATVVHSYIVFTGVLQRYKYSDPASLHLAEYMIELAYAYQSDLGRRVWVEEVGVSPQDMPQSYMPKYMDHTVRNVAATGKAWGITWWCSHDIDPAIKGFDRGEYELGLLDLGNKPKPLGRKFAALASELRSSPPEIVPRKTALVIPDRGLSTKQWPPDWRYAKPYMDLIDRGERPAIVLESRAKDQDYLRKREITDLIPCSC
ncbi:MAG: cellulase family glycosylhydrolase [Bryobacteraceae bacterium]